MSRSTPLAAAIFVLCSAFSGGCAFHRVADRWNGQVGADGEPVVVMSSTYVGLQAFVLLPFLGNTTMDDMIAASTQQITEQEGGRIRLVETETNNYWYGVPPLSWLLTPVMSSVTFEYRPSPRAHGRAGEAPAQAQPVAAEVVGRASASR